MRQILILGIAAAIIVTSGDGADVARAAPPDAGVGIIGTDDRVAVDASVWPWQAIGRVVRNNGTHCTGTLIAPAKVLTAGHCVMEPASGKPAGFPVTFVEGELGGAAENDRRVVSVVTAVQAHDPAHPSAQDISHDWAILTLDRPMTIRPLPVRPLPAEEDGREIEKAQVFRAGYSADRPQSLFADPACHVTQRTKDDRVLVTDCDSALGDSGSPLLVKTGEDIAVVGVSSGVARKESRVRQFVVHATSFSAALNKALESKP